MLPNFGPVELILILVIVTMLFGVGKLPEVFGAVGRGVREFRRNSIDPEDGEEESKEAKPEASSEASSADAASAEAAVPAEKTAESATTQSS